MQLKSATKDGAAGFFNEPPPERRGQQTGSRSGRMMPEQTYAISRYASDDPSSKRALPPVSRRDCRQPLHCLINRDWSARLTRHVPGLLAQTL